MRINISHHALQEIDIIAQGQTVARCTDCSEISTDLTVYKPVKIIVQFKPYGIKPLLRVDGFLIDYWLADVFQQDHQIELELQPDFFERYRSRDRQGRLDSLSDQQKNIDHYLDKYIGTDNLYPDLLVEIRNLLYEKSGIRQSPQD